VVLVIAAVIFAVVAGLVIYCVVRYREGPRNREASQKSDNLTLEVIWTVIPFLILGVLFVLMVRGMHVIVPPVHGETPDVRIVGHQWWWEVHYPKSEVTTANEIHVPVGRRLLLQVESDDVVHSFWVPGLGKKVDAIPTHPNHLWITVDEPGLYLGTCDEFCGAEHAWMRIRVYGEEPSMYKAWTDHQLQDASAPSTGAAERGSRLFQSLTCARCHRIGGTSADGTVGPDLTHIGSRDTLATGVFENTPENLAKWLRDPQAIKPQCNMPSLKLSSPDVQDLAAYLEGLQ
jgi:cytochrome c oxidase subunit 2